MDAILFVMIILIVITTISKQIDRKVISLTHKHIVGYDYGPNHNLNQSELLATYITWQLCHNLNQSELITTCITWQLCHNLNQSELLAIYFTWFLPSLLSNGTVDLEKNNFLHAIHLGFWSTAKIHKILTYRWSLPAQFYHNCLVWE